MDSTLIDEEIVRKRLVQRFPWIEKEIYNNHAEGLIHVELALLRERAEECTKQENITELDNILEFIENLLSQKASLHPDVLNAIEISFIEDLILAENPIYEHAKPHMPQQLLSLAEEIEKQL
jgi:hypothetical protein